MATEIQSKAVGASLIHKVFRVDYTELDAAATSQTIDLITLPDGAEIQDAFVEIVTTLADVGSISNVVVDLGDGSDADAYIDNVDVFGPAAGRYRAFGVNPTASGATLTLTATATGANFGDGAGTTDLDSGALNIHVLYRVL